MLLLEYQNPYWKDNPEFFLELLALVQEHPRNGSYVHRLNASRKTRHNNRKTAHSYCDLLFWIEKVTFQHSRSILDTATRVYWVLNGLEEAPRCQNADCRKPLSKTFDCTKNSNPMYCSIACSNASHQHTSASSSTKHRHAIEDKQYWGKIEQKKKASKARDGHSPNWNNAKKRLQTCQLEVYEDSTYYTKIEQKRKLTKAANGHSPNWHNEQQMVATRYAKNGGVWESQEAISKKEQHSFEKHGCASPNQSSIVKARKKDSCLKKYGVDSYSKTQMYHVQMLAADSRRKQKEHATKSKNGSWSTSAPEDRVHSFLVGIFGKDNVERQHRSQKYPFSCDFYIPCLDLYIECNFSWTHGGHWFDSSSTSDHAMLEKWKSRGTKYYKNAIATWTIRDVKKKECVEKNGLRFIALWREDYGELRRRLDHFIEEDCLHQEVNKH